MASMSHYRVAEALLLKLKRNRHLQDSVTFSTPHTVRNVLLLAMLLTPKP